MDVLAPGQIALMGSGETGPVGGAVYDLLARRFEPPLKIAVLETPAGFQPNSAQVAGKVAGYVQNRLHSYKPLVEVLPARRREQPDSTDDPVVSAALLAANLIFMGPGSPTYAARQLRDSLAWHRLVGRLRRGAALAAASAATIALSAYVLPVYEIYKVGTELHWQPGLDLFGPFGLSLALVPHWNNTEGGAELDTSRCYMGCARFARLRSLLPSEVTVVGIDEHTALVVDLYAGLAEVYGNGAVTIIRGGEEERVGRRETIGLRELGPFRRPGPAEGLPLEIWAELDAAQSCAEPAVPAAVLTLVEERQAARERRDWATADALRQRIAELGWQVQDTRDGPHLEPMPGQTTLTGGT